MHKYQILLIVALVTLMASLSAFGGASLSPILTEVTLPPGSSYEDDISLTNTGDEPINIQVMVRGFTAPDGVPVFLDPSSEAYSYSEYSGRRLLTVTPVQQTIQPGETSLFHYKLAMPENLDPYGGRYVAAIFRVQPPTTGAQVVVATQSASLFLITPGGDGVAPHFTFDDLKVWQDKDNPRLIHSSGLITNDGNLHVNSEQMYGFMHITDEDGYILGQMMWDTHTTLPDNAYTEEQTWLAPDTLPSGTYYLHMTTLIYLPNGEEQRYQATIAVELSFE